MVNCAGLSAVALARAVRGSNPASLPEAFFAKGNYFRYTGVIGSLVIALYNSCLVLVSVFVLLLLLLLLFRLFCVLAYVCWHVLACFAVCVKEKAVYLSVVLHVSVLFVFYFTVQQSRARSSLLLLKTCRSLWEALEPPNGDASPEVSFFSCTPLYACISRPQAQLLSDIWCTRSPSRIRQGSAFTLPWTLLDR